MIIVRADQTLIAIKDGERIIRQTAAGLRIRDRGRTIANGRRASIGPDNNQFALPNNLLK